MLTIFSCFYCFFVYPLWRNVLRVHCPILSRLFCRVKSFVLFFYISSPILWVAFSLSFKAPFFFNFDVIQIIRFYFCCVCFWYHRYFCLFVKTYLCSLILIKTQTYFLVKQLRCIPLYESLNISIHPPPLMDILGCFPFFAVKFCNHISIPVFLSNFL